MVRIQPVWAVALAAVVALTSLSASEVEAGRKRKDKKSQKASDTPKANTKALAELMGAFKFGMAPEDVIKVVTSQITERYAEQVAATTDVYRQDELRRERDKEIEELRRSVVEFNGKKGGWDVSIIDDQFAHKTGESMMVHWETHQGRNQRRFFFFFEGKLYKMFISLDTSALKDNQRNFEFFRELMENRFGKGEVHATGLSWRTSAFHVDALDKLAFYNAFCLIISHPKITERVLALRQERATGPKKRNAVIEAVTAGEEDDTPSLNDGANTIDKILKN